MPAHSSSFPQYIKMVIFLFHETYTTKLLCRTRQEREPLCHMVTKTYSSGNKSKTKTNFFFFFFWTKDHFSHGLTGLN